ncbi:hypothetical protein I317_05195 [Kwoniella heveanensis CBS 569]|nr:hypothetical protein I317_05195 [Kwoniella heveanensis CBS 569]
MKYGKEFQQILESSSFPPDWKESAIEYRQLKKLIKNVVSELTAMGLSPNVLHRLLVTEDGTAHLPTAPIDNDGYNDNNQTESVNVPGGIKGKAAGEEEEVLEFEFESSPENSPPNMQSGSVGGTGANAVAGPSRQRPHSHEPLEVVLDPIPNSPPRIGSLYKDSAESDDIISPHPHLHHHRKFRLRLLSETSQANANARTAGTVEPIRPMNVMQFLEAREAARSPPPKVETPDEKTQEHRGRRVVRKAVMDGHGGVKAEYVLTGDPSNPKPQLRLHLSTSRSPSQSTEESLQSSLPSPSPSPSNSGTDPLAETDTEDEGSDSEVPLSASISATPRAFDPKRFKSPILPSSPTLNRMRTALSPIWAIASGKDLREGMGDLALDPTSYFSNGPEDTVTVTPSPSPNHSPEDIPEISSSSDSDTGSHERDFIIPLSSDLAFFHLLTSALTSLSTFHKRQQTLFKDNVENLCTLISNSISPSSAPEVIPIPLNPSIDRSSDSRAANNAISRIHQPNTKASKKDLYAWREIFTLWVEAEIFESNSERDRGERTVEAAEARLQKFANEVVKRGLGDRRTLRGKRSRKSWEEFLRLNVLLLDLKRFQVANINAARKILKKHDKRTALTASAGFPSFVRSTLSAHVDKDGNVSTWTFYNTSLPHVLLASLTDTLLPILPSLDDYACLICTSIAFKPIRLGCGHLFCVRCLVKMQRAGKEECPLCRSKVILLADKDSLDLTVMK